MDSDIVFFLFCLTSASFIFCVLGISCGRVDGQNSGRIDSLQVLRPCDKTTPLMKQAVKEDTFVCVDGGWKVLPK